MSQRCWACLLLMCFPVLVIQGIAALVARVQQDTGVQPQPVQRLTATAKATAVAADEPPAFQLAAPSPTTRPSNGSKSPGGLLEEVLNAVEQEGVRLAGFDFEDVEIPLIIAIFFFGVGILKISASSECPRHSFNYVV